MVFWSKTPSNGYSPVFTIPLLVPECKKLRLGQVGPGTDEKNRSNSANSLASVVMMGTFELSHIDISFKPLYPSRIAALTNPLLSAAPVGLLEQRSQDYSLSVVDSKL